jgi:hypothetical protein
MFPSTEAYRDLAVKDRHMGFPSELEDEVGS